MKCCDVRTNSLKKYHKECMKNSVEKIHVDVRTKRVRTSAWEAICPRENFELYIV